MELTKDADKMICCIYKSFLQSRKDGIGRNEARRLQEDYFRENTILSKWPDGDIEDTFLELGRNGYLKIHISGNFDLSDNAIIYMENRFKNGLSDVLNSSGILFFLLKSYHLSVRYPAVLAGIDRVVIAVFRYILVFIPAISVKLRQMLHTAIYYQITPLLYPAKL